MIVIVFLVVLVAIQENGYAYPSDDVKDSLKQEEQQNGKEVMEVYRTFVCDGNSVAPMECNMCTCSNGILFCTRMICKKVPKGLWGHVELKDEAKSAALLGSLIGQVKWDLMETIEKIHADKPTQRLGLMDIFGTKLTKSGSKVLRVAVLKKPCLQQQFYTAEKFCQPWD